MGFSIYSTYWEYNTINFHDIFLKSSATNCDKFSNFHFLGFQRDYASALGSTFDLFFELLPAI